MNGQNPYIPSFPILINREKWWQHSWHKGIIGILGINDIVDIDGIVDIDVIVGIYGIVGIVRIDDIVGIMASPILFFIVS